MIYDPRFYGLLRVALTEEISYAVPRFVGQAVTAPGTSWAYYLGLAYGYGIAATATPLANLAVSALGYLIIDVLNSPDGSEATLFVDGIAQYNIYTYAASEIWERLTVPIPDDGEYHTAELRFVGADPANQGGANPVLAIGKIEAQNARSVSMANRVVFQLQDSESDTTTGSHVVYLPDGQTIAEMIIWLNTYIGLLEAVTDSGIVGVVVELDMTDSLTITQTTPQGTVYNERGGLITFDTSGTRRESVRIPGIKTSIMPGDEFDVTESSPGGNLADALIAGIDDGGGLVRPLTPYGYTWENARQGKKSGRKF